MGIESAGNRCGGVHDTQSTPAPPLPAVYGVGGRYATFTTTLPYNWIALRSTIVDRTGYFVRLPVIEARRISPPPPPPCEFVSQQKGKETWYLLQVDERQTKHPMSVSAAEGFEET